MKSIKTLLLGAIIFAGATTVNAQDNVTIVGGEKMYPKKNIVENAINSADHTTLVAAVKAADLVNVLASEGPFTVFAPVNDAFENLPEGTVETLLKPENKGTLTAVLTYHVVPGKLDSKAIMAAIKKGNGKAVLTTVQGAKITAMMNGNNIMLIDGQGNTANVTIKDVDQSNGVIHVIDAVVLPE